MPNQLKSRDELPWLYYPRSNSVRVLNSHLVTSGGGSLAVNGKTPIAAWVPSLDTAGNGTTTLTDLIGSNNGTLTNMDAATDWVADTGAGGVRALDFDGSNDYVLFDSIPMASFSAFSFSMWLKILASKPQQFLSWLHSGVDDMRFETAGANPYWRVDDGSSFQTGSGGSTLNNWAHLVGTFDGTTIRYWQNGVLLTPVAATIDLSDATDNRFAIGGRANGTGFSECRIDDLRMFSVAIDASDVAYLYNSGTGRGRTS